MDKVCHIIVAAGSGSRYGADCPKQFCLLGGRPLLMTTIERMRRAGGDVLIVLSADWMDEWRRMCADCSFDSPPTVAGGETRWHSVSAALDAVGDDVDIITVHDGARPAVDSSLVTRVVNAVACGADGAVPVVEVTDSLRRVDADGTSKAVDRSRFRAVQTPQAFRTDVLRDAYSRPFRPEFTDDASVVEAAGYGPLKLVEGSAANIKVTNPGDIALVENLIERLP